MVTPNVSWNRLQPNTRVSRSSPQCGAVWFFFWLALLSPRGYVFIAPTKPYFIILSGSVAVLKLVINLWVYVHLAHHYQLTNACVTADLASPLHLLITVLWLL